MSTEFRLKSIEKVAPSKTALRDFTEAFANGAKEIGRMGGPVLWHEDLGLWGTFGETWLSNENRRPWNSFGQIPSAFRDHIIVEINPPKAGKNTNVQGVFATDQAGRRWILHQGRMTIRGHIVTQGEFARFSGRTPEMVVFADGEKRPYHKVACIDAKPRVIQTQVAAFVALCGQVRALAGGTMMRPRGFDRVLDWEDLLKPEATGEFDVAERVATKGYRLHGDIWKALAAALKTLKRPHANERVGQYGPDLYTIEAPHLLFEIKSRARPKDLFEGVGQLSIYERLLGKDYRKILVVPRGASAALRTVVGALDIEILEFEAKGRKIVFDGKVLRQLARKS